MKDGEIYLVAQKNLEGNLDFSFSFCRKLPRLALRLSYFNFLRQQGGTFILNFHIEEKIPCAPMQHMCLTII